MNAKKKTLYLHIGFHKTGTTSIQNFFWNNRTALSEEGLLYPTLGNSGPTHALFALSLPGHRDEIVASLSSVESSGHDSSYNKYAGPPADELYAELGCVIRQTDCSRILISSECFMEWIQPSDVRRHLDAYCDCDIKIIVYLRRQDLWIQSVFNQVVKDSYLRYAGELESMPQYAFLDYYAILQEWASQFGKDNVIVRAHNLSAQRPNGTISDILNVLGLEDKNHYQYPQNVRDMNVGLTPEQIRVLHALNRKSASSALFRTVLEYFEKINAECLNGSRFGMYWGIERATELYNSYLATNKMLADLYFNGVNPFQPPQPFEYNGSRAITHDEWAEILINSYCEEDK